MEKFDVHTYLRFLELLHAYRRVERNTCRQGEERHENDAEHTFQVAMSAWYLARVLKVELDMGKVLKYALAHDLVEVYAGDVPAYSKDMEAKARKSAAEHEAAERIRREFPEFTDLHDAIAAYETRDDVESRFVYAVDKLDPLVNDYLDGGRVIKERDLTIQDIIDYNLPRVSRSLDVMPVYEEIMELYKAKSKEIFG